MDLNERLDLILEIISELSSADSVVLVEGRNDIGALNALGAECDFIPVQSSGGPMHVAEEVWRSGRSAVVLTDWDDRGNRIADDLSRCLDSLGVQYDTGIRDRLAYLARPYCKDVESLDSVVRTLSMKDAHCKYNYD